MNREMKATPIPYVTSVPKKWGVDKIARICNTVTDYVASGSFADLAKNVTYLSEPDYAMLVRTADVSGKSTANERPVYIDKHAYNFLSNSNLFGGEILLPNVGTVGEAYIVPHLYEKMSLAPNAIMVRTNYNDRYYYYYFNSDVGSLSIKGIAETAVQAKFNKTNFRQMRVLCPPLQEQDAIVRYLDSKCAAIDEAIERHKKIIEKLEEYRKAEISKAMQALPDVISAKYVFRIYAGATPKSGVQEFWDGEIVWITPADFRTEDHYVNTGKRRITKSGYESCNTTIVPAGSIIVSKRAPIGTVSINTVPLCTNQGCLACVVLPNADNEFYYYALIYKVEHMQALGAGTTFQEISATAFANMKLPYASLNKQRETVDKLTQVSKAVQEYKQRHEHIIAKLEEYRKSIIYHAVTGKTDCREAVK